MFYKVISPCKLYGEYKTIGERVSPDKKTADRLVQAGCLELVQDVPETVPETVASSRKKRKRKTVAVKEEE